MGKLKYETIIFATAYWLNQNRTESSVVEKNALITLWIQWRNSPSFFRFLHAFFLFTCSYLWWGNEINIHVKRNPKRNKKKKKLPCFLFCWNDENLDLHLFIFIDGLQDSSIFIVRINKKKICRYKHISEILYTIKDFFMLFICKWKYELNCIKLGRFCWIGLTFEYIVYFFICLLFFWEIVVRLCVFCWFIF